VRSSLVFCAAALVFALPYGARADDLSGVYARALRYFCPTLSVEQSRRLAVRAVAEADAFALDARLVVALVAVESSWNPTALSPAGARGLGQLMPQTARDLDVDPSDPAANLHGSVRYLRRLLDRYSALSVQERYERALGAYNAGPGAVDRYGTVPPYPETQAYVRKVIGLWRRLSGR
jgi:soluble lytic murein transglycosylase-like protein